MKKELKLLRPIDLKNVLKRHRVRGVGRIVVEGPKKDKNGVYVDFVDTKFYWQGDVVGNTMLWSNPTDLFSCYTLSFDSEEKFHDQIVVTLKRYMEEIGFSIVVNNRESLKKMLVLNCRIYEKLNHKDINKTLSVLLKRKGAKIVDITNIEPDGFDMVVGVNQEIKEITEIVRKYLTLFTSYLFEVQEKQLKNNSGYLIKVRFN